MKKLTLQGTCYLQCKWFPVYLEPLTSLPLSLLKPLECLMQAGRGHAQLAQLESWVS